MTTSSHKRAIVFLMMVSTMLFFVKTTIAHKTFEEQEAATKLLEE